MSIEPRGPDLVGLRAILHGGMSDIPGRMIAPHPTKSHDCRRSHQDWWISSTDRGALRRTAEQLLNLSDLRTSLWSNDEGGDLLLRNLREES